MKNGIFNGISAKSSLLRTELQLGVFRKRLVKSLEFRLTKRHGDCDASYVFVNFTCKDTMLLLFRDSTFNKLYGWR